MRRKHMSLSAIPMFGLKLDCPPWVRIATEDGARTVQQKDECNGTLTIWSYLWVRRPPPPPVPPGYPPGYPEIDRKLQPVMAIFTFKIVTHSVSSDDVRCCGRMQAFATSQPSPAEVPDAGPGGLPLMMNYYAQLPIGQCTEDDHCEQMQVTFSWASSWVPMGVAGGINPVSGLTYTVPAVPGTGSIGGGVPTTAGIGVSVGGPPYQLQVTAGVCPPCQLNPNPIQIDPAHYAADAETVWKLGGIIIK
jgi:hypothetical protein